MTERYIQLVFDGRCEEEEKRVEKGIPQGSPTSSILFLIYLKPLFNELEAKHPRLKFPSYIDDVAIVASSISLESNTEDLAAAAQTAFTWASRNAVAFDDSKSELLHFHRMHSTEESD